MLVGGVHRERLVLYAAPERSVNMMTNETGGVRALDFSSDGSLLVSGTVGSHCFLYHPPGGYQCLFHPLGDIKAIVFPLPLPINAGVHLLPCPGNLRGELAVWDTRHRQHMKSWMGHKRSAITCVKFSNDTKHVYSCGEDAKVWVQMMHCSSPLLCVSETSSPSLSDASNASPLTRAPVSPPVRSFCGTGAPAPSSHC